MHFATLIAELFDLIRIASETCAAWRARPRRKTQIQTVPPGAVGIQSGGDITANNIVITRMHCTRFPKFYPKPADNRGTSTTP